MIRTLLVDDEPPARQRLRSMLADHADVSVTGECGTAAQAVRAITHDRPQLVFLDIALPEADGFTVLAKIAEPPAVVFVTAHTDYAARAFDVAAVDYLVKPYHRERLATAMERVRAHLRQVRTPAPAPPAATPPPVATPLPVGMGRRTRLLDPMEIDYLRAEGNYVRVHTGNDSYLVRGPLTGLVARLDPGRFLRVHRSLAVRVDRIREVETLRHGEFALRLRSGAVLISGRRYRNTLRRALGLPA